MPLIKNIIVSKIKSFILDLYAYRNCNKIIRKRRGILFLFDPELLVRDRLEAVAGSITCHRNEASAEKAGDAGINTKSMINWPVCRRARGRDRTTPPRNSPVYTTRPIVARTGFSSYFLLPTVLVLAASATPAFRRADRHAFSAQS